MRNGRKTQRQPPRKAASADLPGQYSAATGQPARSLAQSPGRQSLSRRVAVDAAVCLLLVAAVFVVFGQTVRHDFVNWDDNEYVYENTHVLGGLNWESFKWALTGRVSCQWHPLTLLSLVVDAELVRPGQGPSGLGRLATWMHLVNLLLHAANVVLLYRLLRVSTAAVWPSAAVAAIFAVHPLHVESVAWITERKDVLSGLFGLLALLAYVRYTQRPSLRRYLVVAVALTAGLMAKPMLVTWPALMLLLDYWPLGRWQGAGSREQGAGSKSADAAGLSAPGSLLSAPRFLLLEKLPLFALVAVFAVISFVGQSSGNTVFSLEAVPLLERIARAAEVVVIYLGKTFWPANLACLYLERQLTNYWPALAAGALLALLTFGAWWASRRTRTVISPLSPEEGPGVRAAAPWLIVGWLWYLGTLLPVLGIVRVGAMVMADRFTYLPQIGLCIAVAWSAAELARSWRLFRLPLAVAAALALAALAACAWRQTSFWRNGVALWSHDVDSDPKSYVAHANFGLALIHVGDWDGAILQYCKELELKPREVGGWANLANALARRGRYRDAIEAYHRALAIDPGDLLTHYNLGYTLSVCGRLDEAIAQYVYVLKRDPGYTRARGAMRMALAQKQELAKRPSTTASPPKSTARPPHGPDNKAAH